jgi:hypothetical protein
LLPISWTNLRILRWHIWPLTIPTLLRIIKPSAASHSFFHVIIWLVIVTKKADKNNVHNDLYVFIYHFQSLPNANLYTS